MPSSNGLKRGLNATLNALCWLAMEQAEAVILAGGKSTRMGSDKARLNINGEQLLRRTATELASIGLPVTILGGDPLPPYSHVADRTQFAGPLAALAAFVPSRKLVFVASCDMPAFSGSVATMVLNVLAAEPRAEAAVPVVSEFRQPLCAAYRPSAFQKCKALHESGIERLMLWLRELDVLEISETQFFARGINLSNLQSVNTPEQLQQFLDSQQ